MSDIGDLAAQISGYLGYIDVIDEAWGNPLPYSCAELLRSAEQGGDPTASWRAEVGAAQEARYHSPAPPAVGAAFVLGWYLQVVAIPLAYASVLCNWLPDASPEALRFDLDEMEHYPVALSLSPGNVESVPHPQIRLRRAREKYEAHANRFAAAYNPGVKMSSRQRYGLVRDTWSMTLDQARTGVAAAPSMLTGLRESCCFIFALPGAMTCTRCPRNAVHA
ncbi:(2Fe-2S)-binding protein [Gephyromycinifex aptenodytis]|uniref:(2Fe-2S)-binding protein n=1 Tax=Gephyromycinifex aptenodytis TaxID=2716227 RepID=UPI0014463F57|nr:(2Fe-2S)-binding protein [Gephyromycinifex aptenodytis]